MEPQFYEPAPKPVEQDAETGDLFAQPIESPAPSEPPEADVEALRRRLTLLAAELLKARGAAGVTTGDLRYSAENRGLLTGHESLHRMNQLKLGQCLRDAGGFPNGEHRRSRAASAKRSLNAVYVTLEFRPVHPVDAERKAGAA